MTSSKIYWITRFKKNISNHYHSNILNDPLEFGYLVFDIRVAFEMETTD